MKIEYLDRNLAHFDEKKENCLLRAIEEKKIRIDSLLFAKGGKIFYERYFGIDDNTLIRVFSICKSFTSLAIGLLVDEKRISLRDRIVDYYNLLTEHEHGYTVFDEGVNETTILDMLTMRTSHSKTTYKVDMTRNWVESFFTIPSDKRPGERFDYETSAAHVLCALVEKMTGMDMLDYIKMKMPELGLSKESYIMKDPFGVSAGGTGLMCTTKDLYRFAYLVANKGCVKDENGNSGQLISAEYITEAVSKMVDTNPEAKYPFERMGYGYYFWQGEHDGYLCYGMKGQFIYFLPKEDLILIATSDCTNAESGEQTLLDLLWNYAAK